MDILILTMLGALKDFSEADLNFTKKDVDAISKNNLDLNNINCNEVGLIVLYENGYITIEKLAELLDCEYEDGQFTITIDSFSDILNDNKYSYEIEILDQTIDYEPHYSDYDADVKYHWDEYDEDTLQSIVEFCIDKKLEYDEVLMTSGNTKVIDGKAYFNDDEIEDLIDDDDLEELHDVLNNAIQEAQEMADRYEAENKVVSSFEDKVGTYERDYIKTSGGKEKEIITIKLNIDLAEIKSEFVSYYGEYEYEYEYYGNLISMLSDHDFFDFDTPDYNYISGTVEKSDLNEITNDRLSW